MTKLLIDEYPLMVLPSLAKAIGLNEAIILQQIHYWLGKSSHKHDGRKWVYSTYDGWQEQFPFWSVSTIRRTLENLRNKGLVIATDQYNKREFDNTLWYTIDHDSLSKMDTSSAQNEQTIWSEWTEDVVNMNRPIPETTTETSVSDVVDDKANAFGAVVKCYEENIGVITQHIGEELGALVDEVGATYVIKGIHIAVEANKRSLSYARSCARNLANGTEPPVKHRQGRGRDRPKREHKPGDYQVDTLDGPDYSRKRVQYSQWST